MTTTTCPTTQITCRCGHVDRTQRHSCRMVRSLASFRSGLLDEILMDDRRRAGEFDADALVAHEAEMSAPWCSICDGLGHTGEAHERGVDDGFDAWEAGRLGW